MITLERLIIALREEHVDDLQQQVEFIVVTTDGRIITMGVQSQAKPIIKALRMFGSA